jgi:hypothetical protein
VTPDRRDGTLDEPGSAITRGATTCLCLVWSGCPVITERSDGIRKREQTTVNTWSDRIDGQLPLA